MNAPCWCARGGGAVGDFIRGLLGLFVALSVAGCSASERHLLFYGSDPHIDPVKAAEFATRQEQVVIQIAKAGGLQPNREVPGPAPGTVQGAYDTSKWAGKEWGIFVRSGINYVDTQCNQYLEALNRFYRAKNTTKQQTVLAGAATMGIMGAVNVAAQALAITGIAFGFATASIDNLAGGLIFELPAADVTQLVRTMQQTYKGALPADGYKDQPAAYAAIQGYINICMQSTIETQVANAVKQARLGVQKGNASTGAAPVVQVGPLTTYTYSADDNTALLKKYVSKADGSPDSAKMLEVTKALKAEGIDLTPVDILTGFPEERERVVKRLGLK